MKSTMGKRILLGQLGLNGDCLHVTVIARQIKQDYPGCHLTWAISSLCRSVIEENPYVDQIWELPASSWDEIVVATWTRFEQEAQRRFAAGEFDEIFLTQVYPRNGQNYDGTTRVSHFRGYPGDFTVPLQSIIRLRHEEVQRVREFAEQNHLARYRHVILFECKSGSKQSFVTPEYALHVSQGILNIIPECGIVLSSNIKIASQDDRIIDGSVLSLRENAELTKYCTLFIGCSSGITQIVLTDWAKPLPMIQLLSGATSVYASVVHDLEYWKQPISHILEMTDIPPEKLIECIIVAFTKGFSDARSRFHQYIPLNFTFYLYHFRAFILPTSYVKAAQSLLHTVRRYGLHPQLKAFIENEFVHRINLPSAIPINDQTCINLLEGFIRSQGQDPTRTNLYILKEPIVSICIPTYNGEKFLSDALSSVLSQTYQDIEIIISDDGSTDRTLEIAKSFQNQTSKDFIVISHRNYGLVPNWNFCIQHAKGKYIKFLHQDDVLEPDCVRDLVNIAEQDDEIGLVFSARGLLMSAGAENDPSCMSDYQHVRDLHKSWTELQTIQSGQKLLEDSNLFNWPINKFGEPTTVLIKKEVFEKIGGFDAELCQLVDVEMWLRIMSQYKIGFADKVLSQWRIHPEQQTRRNARERQTMTADWQKFYDKIAKDSRYPEKVRQDALQRLSAMTPQQDNPRHIRKQLAESWLKVPPEFLEKAYSGDMGNFHRKLIESNIRNESLTQEENVLLQHLIAELTKRSATDPASAIGYLLAAMLYLPSGRLKIENANTSLPGWLIGDYERFFKINHKS